MRKSTDILRSFKTRLKEELLSEAVSEKDLEALGNLAFYIPTLSNDVNDMLPRLVESDRKFSKHKLRVNITNGPNTKKFAPIISKYRTYRARVQTQEAQGNV